MHYKRHNPSGQNIILHPRVPRGPKPFSNIELGVEFGDILILAPVGARRQRSGIPINVRI